MSPKIFLLPVLDQYNMYMTNINDAISLLLYSIRGAFIICR